MYYKCTRRCVEHPIYQNLCLGNVMSDPIVPCKDCKEECERMFDTNMMNAQVCTKECLQVCTKKTLANILEYLE
jgi:hypothetical protein